VSRRYVGLTLFPILMFPILALDGLALAEGARSGSGGSAAPFDLGDPAIVQEGAHLFRANCTHYCHHPQGLAARAPALRGRDLSPDFVFQRIAKGLAPMPAYETVLSSEQIWKLVAYVESLARAKD
jgi:mono/diheme cytochrome c family protein